MSESSENAQYTCPEPKVMSLKCLFCLTNSLKSKNIPFSMTYNRKAANLDIWEAGIREYLAF